MLRRLGTRHRAAIGVTEETDALAIVVSEETGQIAIASRGDLEPDVSLERLEERLTRHTTGKADAGSASEPAGSRLSRERCGLPRISAGSSALAGGIGPAVVRRIVGEPDLVTTRTVPILYQQSGAMAVMVTGDSPETVRLELRGPAGRLPVDSSRRDRGAVRSWRTSTVPASARSRSPIQSQRCRPASRSCARSRRSCGCDLRAWRRRRFRCEVRFFGSAAAGYRLVVGNGVAPEQLRIAGPETASTRVSSVQTDAIDLGGAHASRRTVA